MIDPKDIYSLSEFQRTAKASLARLKKSGRPVVLTLNGFAAAVVQSPKEFKRLVLLADEALEMRRLEESIAQAKRGEGTPAAEAFRRLRAKSKPISRRRSA